MVSDQLLQMKKRTSQLKGELNDGLTDIISDNFRSFFQISQQLTAQIDNRDKTIEAMQKTIDEYESAHPELKIAREKAKTVKSAGKK